MNLISIITSIINDYRWLSKAESILSPEPYCLNFIHRTAISIITNKVKLSAIQIEKLELARRCALGRYFEILISTLFYISHEIELTYTNVTVRKEKTTTGEFDLLYKKDGYWYHLELAIKFYLGRMDQTSEFNWHGPAMRDTLGRKRAQMNNQQLKLPKTNAGIEVLKNLSINSLKSEALMLGRLFYPYADWVSNLLVAPSNTSINHANGWCMYETAVCSLSEGNHFFYLPLMKYDWMAKTKIHSLPSKPNFNDIKEPKMVAVYKRGEKNKIFEIQRGFIVPNNWGKK